MQVFVLLSVVALAVAAPKPDLVSGGWGGAGWPSAGWGDDWQGAQPWGGHVVKSVVQPVAVAKPAATSYATISTVVSHPQIVKQVAVAQPHVVVAQPQPLISKVVVPQPVVSKVITADPWGQAPWGQAPWGQASWGHGVAAAPWGQGVVAAPWGHGW